jgi:DNA-binding NarL/FixJ family response regulator
MTRLLAGKRVLVVEDHIIIAMDIAHELAAQEAKVVGPVGTLDGALKAIKDTDLDGVILDLNLGGNAAFPVADALADRHIPFVFATGTWSQVTYRLATQTCHVSKNLRRPVPFVQRSKPQCRPLQAKNKSITMRLAVRIP